MHIGKGFTLGYNGRIECNGILKDKKLIIGNNCIIGDYVHIVANHKVRIGNNVLIASRVFITDTNHGNYKGNSQSRPTEAPNSRKLFYSPVKIGDNVWIGENVSILPGVEIGNGCIIGANSVVTKNIPQNCIAVGNSAKVIKIYNKEEQKWST